MRVFSGKLLGRKVAKAWNMGTRPRAYCPKCGLDCGTGDGLTHHLEEVHQWRLMSAVEKAAEEAT